MTYAKAVVAAVVSLASYLAALIPAEGGIGDVTIAQWLGAVGVVAAAAGLTYAIPNKPAQT